MACGTISRHVVLGALMGFIKSDLVTYGIQTSFLMSNTFISTTRLKLTNNYAKTKQQPEADVLMSK